MIRLIPISTGRKWIKILIRQNVAVRSKSNTNRISCFSLCFTKMITRKGQKVILLSDQVQNHISLWSVDYHLRATLKQLSASSTSCSYRTSRVLFKCDHQVYVISCVHGLFWFHLNSQLTENNKRSAGYTSLILVFICVLSLCHRVTIKWQFSLFLFSKPNIRDSPTHHNIAPL